MGFHVDHVEPVALLDAEAHQLLLPQERGVGLSMAMDMYTSVSMRHDLNDATQIYAACSAGAVRIDEELVVAVEIDEVA